MKQIKTGFYGLVMRATTYRDLIGPSRQGGATAIEYALIAAVMVVAVTAAFLVLGDGLETFFQDTVLPTLENPSGS